MVISWEENRDDLGRPGARGPGDAEDAQTLRAPDTSDTHRYAVHMLGVSRSGADPGRTCKKLSEKVSRGQVVVP